MSATLIMPYFYLSSSSLCQRWPWSAIYKQLGPKFDHRRAPTWAAWAAPPTTCIPRIHATCPAPYDALPRRQSPRPFGPALATPRWAWQAGRFPLAVTGRALRPGQWAWQLPAGRIAHALGPVRPQFTLRKQFLWLWRGPLFPALPCPAPSKA